MLNLKNSVILGDSKGKRYYSKNIMRLEFWYGKGCGEVSQYIMIPNQEQKEIRVNIRVKFGLYICLRKLYIPYYRRK